MTDPDILNAINTYKPLINKDKAKELDVGSYKVDKPWGYEIWLEINEFYAYKIIHMKAGHQSSLQSHEKKYETNYVIEGEAVVLLEDDNGVMQRHKYGPGMGWSVPIGRKHRICALTDYTCVECSTPHLDDVIRYEDDTGRKSGKIDSEHHE